jgi:hypothetical protein
MENRMTRLLTKCVTTLALTLAFAQQPAYSQQVTPPDVPDAIQVPAGHRAFLLGHAAGTQNYICLPGGTSSGVAWMLFGPQATLFDDAGRQITTHFLSGNPVEGDTLRATWQHSRDTSAVWAMAIASSLVDDTIPWLLLRVTGAQHGHAGGARLSRTTFIHRVNTVGGVAPAAGCDLPSDVGSRQFVPYEADYIFYRDRRAPAHDD